MQYLTFSVLKCQFNPWLDDAEDMLTLLDRNLFDFASEHEEILRLRQNRPNENT